MTLIANRYRIDALLGQGGMGQVHLAHDTILARKVAIKMMRDDAQHDTHARERFRREALATAALDHPFICKIHEVGEHEGRSFIVMEFIEGRTLDRVARDGPLTPRQVLDCAHEIVQALDEAHRRGLVHRDLKPSNIMLTVHGHVKVLDFGLAKQFDAPALNDSAATVTDLTDPGTRLGTPAYMSPEQVLGSGLDPRSDVFSLGTVLHEIAGGVHPFQKPLSWETMAAILRDPPALSEEALDIVPGFGRMVHRMLAKACAERYQTMAELRAEIDGLRDGSGAVAPLSGALSGSVSARIEPPERTQFVARDAELAELTRHLDRMLLGQGGLVLLGGEPGVGKTRLAREVQRLGRARGCLTLTGQCYEHGAPPFGPFVETVEQSVRMVPHAVRAALGGVAPEVATMAPVLRQVFPDIAEPAPVPADQQRRVLFNAYLEYVRRGTQKSAAVLLFDDLHWADEPSLQLLLHIVPHLASMRMLVVGTYRDVELDAARPFARTLETLLLKRLAPRLTVKRLTEPETGQMLATMSGSAPPSTIVRVVHAETDGNPFFVEEVFQHLAEERKIFDAAGRWRTDLAADAIDVPEGVRLVITRRLERLGDNARKVLTAAAVIGRSFPLDVLLAVTDVPEEAVIDLLEDAQKAQLVQAERGREARYTFVHELIRSTLGSAMPLPRRQRLHAKVADAIEDLRAASSDAHAPMLAHHLYEAGAVVGVERTTRALLKAMERAQAAGAFEEVLAFVEQVRSLDLPDGAAELGTAEDAMARALLGLARVDEALAPARRALDIWIARGDDAGIARAAANFWNAALWGSVGMRQASAMAERALHALSPAAGRERTILQNLYAGHLVQTGRLAEAVALGESTVRAAEAIGEVPSLGAACSMHANVLRFTGRFAEALAYAERACTLLEGSRTWLEADARWGRAANLYYTGQLSRLGRDLAASDALALQVGHLGGQFVGRRLAASRALILDADFAQFVDEALVELTRPGNAQWQVLTRAPLAGVYLARGEVQEARAQLDALAGLEATGYAGLQEGALFGLHAWAGELDTARALFPSLAPVLARAGQLNTFGQWMALGIAVSSLALLDDRAACAALYPAAHEFIGLGHVVDIMSLGPNTSHLTAGIAADAAGLADAAGQHFAAARGVADRLPSRLLRAFVELWHGRHLRGRDRAEALRGEAMLRTAATRFADLAMPIHERLARQWLAG